MRLDTIHTYPNIGPGIKITIELDPHEDAALGSDSGVMIDQLMTVFCAITALRSGATDPVMAGQAFTAIRKLDSCMDGVRDAVIRGWQGSIGDLAAAMEAPSRSTAQSRRDAVLSRIPSPGEEWATGQRSPVVAPVCQYGSGNCGNLATHDLVFDGASVGLSMCFDHARTKMNTLIDRGADHVGIHKIGPTR